MTDALQIAEGLLLGPAAAYLLSNPSRAPQVVRSQPGDKDKAIGSDTPQLSPTNTNKYGFGMRLMEDVIIPPDYWQALIFVYMARSKDGRDWLKDIIKEYLKTLQQVMGHLAQASTANIVTAWVNPLLISNILEHNYMVHSGSTGGLEMSTQYLVAAQEANTLIGTIFGTAAFGPSSLILAGVGQPEESEKTRGIRKQREAIEQKGTAQRNVSTAIQAAAAIIPKVAEAAAVA